MPIQQIQVRPSGWNSSSEEINSFISRFTLSNYDALMPKVFIQIFENLELPFDTDKNLVLENLIKGLQFSLSQYPPLAGVLNMDENTGRFGRFVLDTIYRSSILTLGY